MFQSAAEIVCYQFFYLLTKIWWFHFFVSFYDNLAKTDEIYAFLCAIAYYEIKTKKFYVNFVNLIKNLIFKQNYLIISKGWQRLEWIFSDFLFRYSSNKADSARNFQTKRC